MAKTKKSRAGRPPVYTGNLKAHIVSLIRSYNIAQAMGILNATAKESDWVKLRNTKLVPKPLGISYPTLHKFAVEAGIKVSRGRPVVEKATEAA